jgi:hypothetical protein
MYLKCICDFLFMYMHNHTDEHVCILNEYMISISYDSSYFLAFHANSLCWQHIPASWIVGRVTTP